MQACMHTQSKHSKKPCWQVIPHAGGWSEGGVGLNGQIDHSLESEEPVRGREGWEEMQFWKAGIE